jgi:hypothetical protein
VIAWELLLLDDHRLQLLTIREEGRIVISVIANVLLLLLVVA